MEEAGEKLRKASEEKHQDIAQKIGKDRYRHKGKKETQSRTFMGVVT